MALRLTMPIPPQPDDAPIVAGSTVYDPDRGGHYPAHEQQTPPTTTERG